MYFYYSNENIEDFFLKSLVLFSTLFLVGYWRMTDKEGMSVTARGGTKFMGKMTVLDCQNTCQREKKCKYIQTPAGSSKKYDKVDCYIDVLGTGQDPIKTGRFDIWKNKLFKRPNPCNEKKKTSRGKDGKKGSDYRGCINWTKRGMPCQKWTSQRPHKHSRYPTNRKFKNKGLGNHNYCRNPDGEPGGIWCYTNLKKKRWDYCVGGSASESLPNLALRKPARQSSTGWRGVPSRGVDGNTNTRWGGRSCTHTQKWGNQWWHVDLGNNQKVSKVVIYNRQDCCNRRLDGAKVCIGPTAASVQRGSTSGLTCKTIPRGSSGPVITLNFNPPARGRFVAVKHKNQYITLCEVKVFGSK